MTKLTKKDMKQINQYIMQEPEFNLLIIGDLENLGLEDKNLDVYVNDTKDGWDSLVLRYFDNYILYSSHAGYDAEEVANFLAGKDVNVVSGKGEILERLAPYMANRCVVKNRLAHLHKVEFCPKAPEPVEIRRLSPGDAAAMVSLYLQIKEFSSTYVGRQAKAEEELRCTLQKGGRSYGAFLNGELVGIASTSAENSVSAMVVGVATLPSARNLGLASCLVAQLCRETLREGRKFLCLFYNNPIAGKIYYKIGFRDTGNFIMLKRNTESYGE